MICGEEKMSLQRGGVAEREPRGPSGAEREENVSMNCHSRTVCSSVMRSTCGGCDGSHTCKNSPFNKGWWLKKRAGLCVWLCGRALACRPEAPGSQPRVGEERGRCGVLLDRPLSDSAQVPASSPGVFSTSGVRTPMNKQTPADRD